MNGTDTGSLKYKEKDMGNRKAISKKTRFEVFKRDSFRCQYCGRGVDETILEVDHIQPVAEGGTNDLINLITSCRDCNRGKGKRKLSDRVVAEKESKFLEEEQARLEQSQMVIEWKKELLKQRESEVEYIADYIETITDWMVTAHGKKTIRSLINQFGFKEVCEATEISYSQYYKDTEWSWDNAFKKIGGICYNRRKQWESKDQ